MSFFSNILKAANKKAGLNYKPDWAKLRGEATNNNPYPDNSQGVVISNQNPQSWAPDIHPNGREHSTYIDSIDYDGNTKSMRVSFTNGFSCEIPDVSKEEAKAFNEADSKGRYYNEHFANKPYKVL